jgi:hypothetical protein
MKVIIIAAALLATPALAQTSTTTTTTGGAAATTGTAGSFNLTAEQEARLGPIIQRNPVVRAGQVAVGTALPADVELRTFPQQYVTEVPSVSSYRYVSTEQGILVVDPSSRRVVRVIANR